MNHLVSKIMGALLALFFMIGWDEHAIGEESQILWLRLQLQSLATSEARIQAKKQGDTNLTTLYDSTVSILSQELRQGQLPRQRSRFIGPDELLVQGLDDVGQEVARQVMTDPRLIRYEEVDLQTGRLLFRSDFIQKEELSIMLPNDARIRAVRVLQPGWKDGVWHPHVIGTAQLSNQRSPQ
ncbi:MAG: hypothetical protein H7839_09590 [Magnetococcus sp. YQC-5]